MGSYLTPIFEYRCERVFPKKGVSFFSQSCFRKSVVLWVILLDKKLGSSEVKPRYFFSGRVSVNPKKCSDIYVPAEQAMDQSLPPTEAVKPMIRREKLVCRKNTDLHWGTLSETQLLLF